LLTIERAWRRALDGSMAHRIFTGIVAASVTILMLVAVVVLSLCWLLVMIVFLLVRMAGKLEAGGDGDGGGE
jgi:hypothetical protein